MKSPLLISMHMEKCGGTSLQALLQQQYGSGFQLYNPGYPGSAKVFIPRTETECLHGHMYYGVHRFFPNRQYNYITLLRDPVARFLSNFHHIRRYNHPLHELVNAEDGLQAFCENDDARYYRNLFVRRLAGVEGEPGEADLEIAAARLSKFALVGKVERLTEFVQAASKKFSWAVMEIPYKNAALNQPLKSQYSATEMAGVTKANELDIELLRRVEGKIS